MNDRLPTHEWLSVVVVLSTIVAVMTLSVLNATPTPEPAATATSHTPRYIQDKEMIAKDTKDAKDTTKDTKEIKVSIDGAVAKPDTYTLKKGTTLRELFELAQPLPNARLARFHLDRKLVNGESIFVGTVKMITVHVTGAVQAPQTLQIRKGSALRDLEPLLTLSDNADTAFLQKKRKLKDGETLNIPYLTVAKT